MLQDVDAWLQGYSGITGIWIDEYYPKREYTVDDRTDATKNPDGTPGALWQRLPLYFDREIDLLTKRTRP